jgi:membrane fusion protein, multidrug efflux system
VLTGMPEGTRVIVAGQDFVTDGEVVNPVPADEALLKKLVGEATTTQ